MGKILAFLSKIGKWIYANKFWLTPIFKFIINSIKKSKVMSETLVPKEVIKDLTKKIDAAIKLKGIMETLDGIVIGFLLGFINSFGYKKLSPEYRDLVSNFLTDISEGNWDAVDESGAALLTKIVDIPNMDEDKEFQAFKSALSFLIDLLGLSKPE